MGRFADALEPHLGLRPEIPDLATLVRLLHRLAADRRALVVIDEFPYLLPGRGKAVREALSQVQAAIEEERDSSQLKLVLCGSHLAQMRTLLAEESPLRRRLTPLAVEPLLSRVPAVPRRRRGRAIERFAVAGGMAMYLAELGGGGSLQSSSATPCSTAAGRCSTIRARCSRRNSAGPGPTSRCSRSSPSASEAWTS